MAELKFEKNGSSSCLVVMGGVCVGELVVSLDKQWRFKTLLSDKYYIIGADEHEQIAAKLRELNGEPNTRALDERVKAWDAFKTWLEDAPEQFLDADVLWSKMRELEGQLKESQDAN